MRRCLAFLALSVFFMFPLSANAFLVNYEIDGTVDASTLQWAPAGTPMTAFLSFNPGQATPADPAAVPGVFDFHPGTMRLMLTIGPRTVVADHTGGSAALFKTDGFAFHEVLFTDPALTRFSFAGGGQNLFDEPPVDSLDGGRWQNITQGVGKWFANNLSTQESAEGSYTRFRLIDTNPTPEPASWVTLTAGLLALGGFRYGFGLRRKRGRPTSASKI